MKSPKAILIVFINCIFAIASGQDVTQPLPPFLDRVTVDPYTGKSVLYWLPSPSSDVGSYVIYTFNEGLGTVRDTVKSPYITEYTYSGSAARYKSEAYVVAAMDSSLNISPLSNSLSTIFLSMVNDTCNGRIRLSWTPYLNNAHPATDYIVCLSVNGSGAGPVQKVPASATTFDLYGYNPENEYCFFVKATDGENDLSSSNRQCVISGSEGPPSWTRIDAVEVSSRTIIINAGYDPDSEIQKFSAERHENGASWTMVGTEYGSGGNVSISDTNADTSKVNLYRISAINNCNRPVAFSEPARNIVLTTASDGTDVLLRWNNPLPEEGVSFTVWRNTGSGFEEIATGLSDTSWNENYRDYYREITSDRISYRVSASRQVKSAGATSFISNISFISPENNIFVANSFTPDDDGLNDFFAPVLSFTPVRYSFRISSRQGVLVFSTVNYGTPWDGRNNGTRMPAGVYLWSLRVTTPSGRTIEKNGTVTILR